MKQKRYQASKLEVMEGYPPSKLCYSILVCHSNWQAWCNLRNELLGVVWVNKQPTSKWHKLAEPSHYTGNKRVQIGGSKVTVSYYPLVKFSNLARVSFVIKGNEDTKYCLDGFWDEKIKDRVLELVGYQYDYPKAELKEWIAREQEKLREEVKTTGIGDKVTIVQGASRIPRAYPKKGVNF